MKRTPQPGARRSGRLHSSTPVPESVNEKVEEKEDSPTPSRRLRNLPGRSSSLFRDDSHSPELSTVDIPYPLRSRETSASTRTPSKSPVASPRLNSSAQGSFKTPLSIPRRRSMHSTSMSSDSSSVVALPISEPKPKSPPPRRDSESPVYSKLRKRASTTTTAAAVTSPRSPTLRTTTPSTLIETRPASSQRLRQSSVAPEEPITVVAEESTVDDGPPKPRRTRMSTASTMFPVSPRAVSAISPKSSVVNDPFSSRPGPTLRRSSLMYPPGVSTPPPSVPSEVFPRGLTSSLVMSAPGRRGRPPVARSDFKPTVTFRKANSEEAVSTTLQAVSPKKASPMKTRALQKKNARGCQYCTLCKDVRGDLQQCANCKLSYHLRKCLLYPVTTVFHVESRQDWLCPKCILCTKCGTFVDDPNNVECMQCTRAWHGNCKPHSVSLSNPREWVCDMCTGVGRKSNSASPNKLPTSPAVSPSLKEKKGRGRKTEQPSASLHPTPPQLVSTTSADVIARRDQLYDELFEIAKIDKSDRSPRRASPLKSPSKGSPMKRKTTTTLSSPEKSQPLPRDKIALPEDVALFEAAMAAYLAEQPAATVTQNTSDPAETLEQWVYIGKETKMKTVYPSPYPDDVKNAPNLYVCQFCLKASGDLVQYRIHTAHCPWHHPPGNEIYRDEKISFFEVDGAEEKSYCRNLCLLAKLFLSSKILHHEVETFWFYVLTENTSRGCEIVGYFSKEKNPSKDNNLSCLLTLPCAQKSGYGRMLIDMSYELSRLERKVGGPEHPLSDLGLKAYKGYWRAAILAYLRSIRSNHQVSVTDMSLSTRIMRHDIVSQLMRDKLLVMKDGTYFIKTGSRACKFPLSASRRPTIDPSKILWEPEVDVSGLDANKLNGYTFRGDT